MLMKGRLLNFYSVAGLLSSKKMSIVNQMHPISSSNLRGNGSVSNSYYSEAFENSGTKNNITSTGLPLETVVEKLNAYADLSLAESWDNVGLLIEPLQKKLISRILLTNDLTESVMREALQTPTVDMIISYHPPIFAPLKSVTTRTWKERIVANCIENKIALYSPHTSFDSINGGVNDWLVSAFEKFGGKNSEPIEKCQNNPSNGMGRISKLNRFISLTEAIDAIKKLTGLSLIRYSRAVGIKEDDDCIKTVAFCAGSGSSVLKGVVADLYVTGEMSHHELLDATHNGSHVILTEHSNSERGFLKDVFANKLRRMLDNSVVVKVSSADQDPVNIV